MTSELYGPGVPVTDVRAYGGEYFRENYNTKLSPEDEMSYSAWLGDLAKAQGGNVDNYSNDYDMKGYWLENKTAKKGEGEHFPDTYKKPNHPTFSTESKYHGAKSPFGGVHVGGSWLDNYQYFAPSPTMLKTTHDKPWLEDYFAKYEKNTKILYPKGYE